MAPLPPARLQAMNPPFMYIGVDYFGPLHVRHGRKTEKHYGCLFTCLTTRACHLELASSLDTDSFLLAFRRMIARRGSPALVFSDNGTNLTAGERELRESLRELNADNVNRELARKQIEWHFKPP